MLTRAAGRACGHSVPSSAEGSGAYEYIRGIHGDLNRGATDRGSSESEK